MQQEEGVEDRVGVAFLPSKILVNLAKLILVGVLLKDRKRDAQEVENDGREEQKREEEGE